MKKIKNKCQELIHDKNLYIFSIITIAFFGVFCLVQYAPDTYSVFTNGVRNSVIHFFSCGRYITGLATIIAMKILQLSNEGTYYLSYIFAILCTIISLYKLNKLIQKETKSNLLSGIIATIIIINPFSIELFMYIEKGIMMFSVLLCIIAVEQIDKFFQGNKKAIFSAVICMFIANCSYQGTVGLFVVISLFYILKYSKNIKEFIKNNIVVALVYGIPAIANFLSIRLFFTSTRVNGNMVLSETLIKVVEGTKKMVVNTYDILPKYLFFIVIVILLIVIIYKALKIKENRKKIVVIASTFYILAGTLFATIAPQMLQDTNAIWFVARSSYPMATIIGLLLLYLCERFDCFQHKIEKNIILVIITILLIIQLISFMNLTIDNHIGNYKDKEITNEIISQIEEYEKNTEYTIDTISIYHDESIQYVYPELKASGDMNIRAYSADWCVSRILKLYSNRDFKVIENEQSIKEDFLKHNWNDFNPKQIIFKNNVMHLCIF